MVGTTAPVQAAAGVTTSLVRTRRSTVRSFPSSSLPHADAQAGINRDGGYAEYVTLRTEAVAPVPEGFDPAEAAPFFCAGVTLYNSLRNAGARAGDVVAVQGIGGLGHLGIQFSRAMGFKTVALSSGDSKRALATELGAHIYVDSSKEDPATALQALGGASVIASTAPNAKTIGPLVNGLGVNGKLLLLALSEDVTVPVGEFSPCLFELKSRMLIKASSHHDC
jgi:D-arabinose 1-dehydrogenase-like Zn-dependent alcohol dehydrogenase